MKYIHHPPTDGLSGSLLVPVPALSFSCFCLLCLCMCVPAVLSYQLFITSTTNRQIYDRTANNVPNVLVYKNMLMCTLWAIILNTPTDLTFVSWQPKPPLNQRLIDFIRWHGVVSCVTLKSDVWAVGTCLMCLIGGRWINWRRSTGEKERIYRWWKNRESESTKLTGYTISSAQNRLVHKTRALIFLIYMDILHLFYCDLGLNGEFHHLQDSESSSSQTLLTETLMTDTTVFLLMCCPQVLYPNPEIDLEPGRGVRKLIKWYL